MPIALGPCGIVESLYVLWGRERRTGTKCVGRKGKIGKSGPIGKNTVGLTAWQEMQGRM